MPVHKAQPNQRAVRVSRDVIRQYEQRHLVSDDLLAADAQVADAQQPERRRATQHVTRFIELVANHMLHVHLACRKRGRGASHESLKPVHSHIVIVANPQLTQAARVGGDHLKHHNPRRFGHPDGKTLQTAARSFCCAADERVCQTLLWYAAVGRQVQLQP
jgi:hypothetical protein